ncbi:MAG: hypothetical protein SAK29_23995 [Scytonema sp. PMC 1069.18]|nr:hypothetical protein [Scytonema sp. PMC 1069.18]MEC4882486.1 hypothetical protein [Scytonema sp. PMC 1070.18]
MSTIVHPFHYLIYEREGATWYAKEGGGVFYNPTKEPMKLDRVAEQFGLKDTEVVIELFRLNGGKPGYYLANLRDKKYYYCGATWDGVKQKLLDLGIGRTSPVES